MLRFLFPLLCLPLLTQCNKQTLSETNQKETTLAKFTYHEPMMGTRFSIVLYADNKKNADTSARAAFEYAMEVNRVCSDYDVTSELMQLNSAPANVPFKCSPMFFEVLNRAIKIATLTNGAYDPTLGWHSYNWRMARKNGVLPTPGQIAKAKAASGWQNLKLDPDQQSATKLVMNMRLDLGGIAKGYAADGMLDLLEKNSITRASVIAGGEVLLGDPPPGKDGWPVTLKTLDANYTITPKTVIKSNCAISTSGDIHQSITIGGQRYSHIVDPTTGLGLTRRISATVIGPNATLTDALATAFCVNSQLSHPGVQTMIVIEKKDGSVEVTRAPE